MKLNETPQERDAKLAAAAAAANAATKVQGGGERVKFQLPDRRPYEPKATKKQKDLLWALGVQDVTFLEALGKWQAVAMIDQIKAKQNKEGNVALFRMALIVGAVGFLIWLLAKFMG